MYIHNKNSSSCYHSIHLVLYNYIEYYMYTMITTGNTLYIKNKTFFYLINNLFCCVCIYILYNHVCIFVIYGCLLQPYDKISHNVLLYKCVCVCFA